MPRPPRPSTVVLSGLLALGPLAAAPAVAQPVAPTPAGAAPVRAAAIANLPAGVPVRVAVRAGRLAGRFQRVAADTVLVGVDAAATARVAVADVDTLWARTGRGTGRGAKIGAKLGGVALGGFAVFLFNALCDTGNCEFGRDEWTGVAVVTAVGAAGGALVGAGVGSLVRTWRRVYP